MSTQSTLPLFGRKYLLTITPMAGNPVTLSCDNWEPEALKIVFTIEQTAYTAIWEAFISIYNLNAATQDLLFQQGDSVSLSAGYQVGSNYGNLFTGKILRCTFEKEKVTDYKLTLQCLTGMPEYINSLVNFATGPFQSQNQIIQQMADNASTPFVVTNVSSKVKPGQLPCPKVFFGAPKHYLNDIARDNNMVWTAMKSGVSVSDFDLASPTPDLIYSSPIPPGSNVTPDPSINYSLVGTPQQVDNGVTFRVLLDSRIQISLPPMGIKIDNTVIRQQPVAVGTLPPVLSQDGIYAVIGVRHIADSRGTPWYTEVHGVVVNSQLVAMGLTSPNMDIHQSNQTK